MWVQFLFTHTNKSVSTKLIFHSTSSLVWYYSEFLFKKWKNIMLAIIWVSSPILTHDVRLPPNGPCLASTSLVCDITRFQFMQDPEKNVFPLPSPATKVMKSWLCCCKLWLNTNLMIHGKSLLKLCNRCTVCCNSISHNLFRSGSVSFLFFLKFCYKCVQWWYILYNIITITIIIACFYAY